MIRFIRSIQTAGDKHGDALQWAVEVNTYVNSKFPQAKFQVFTGRFGTRNRIYWMNDQENLGEVEKFWAALEADEGFQGLIAKTTGIFVEGSLQDEVLLSLG